MRTHTEFQPTKILVPTDFSPSADDALKTATAWAKCVGAVVYLFHVVPILPIVGVPDYPVALSEERELLDDARRHATERLAVAVAKLDSAGVRAEFGIEIGNDIIGNILMVFKREQVDMIVISTHGMSGWRPIVFGSIAEKVVRLADCPLLLLRSNKDVDHHKRRHERVAHIGGGFFIDRCLDALTVA